MVGEHGEHYTEQLVTGQLLNIQSHNVHRQVHTAKVSILQIDNKYIPKRLSTLCLAISGSQVWNITHRIMHVCMYVCTGLMLFCLGTAIYLLDIPKQPTRMNPIYIAQDSICS